MYENNTRYNTGNCYLDIMNELQDLRLRWEQTDSRSEKIFITKQIKSLKSVWKKL